MKKLGFISVITSAMLLVSFSTMTLSADEGMGKCGNSKEKMKDRKMMDDEKMKEGKCGTKKEMKRKNMMDNEKCEGKRSEMTKEKMMKKDDKKPMKCGVGKCGS
ncbi:hypothetical protein [Sulfurimonas sp. C5]|uniref:hypothetical protein n=1 Tax=Sulfurimonas sp. C5 TaxID=3036947 RepID=UPI002455986D|nr:hypothetical protein [Sulfurimonas sp. C5]MDH4944291.1 hypothetical protein [Sulfurimonas sp. C5]